MTRDVELDNEENKPLKSEVLRCSGPEWMDRENSFTRQRVVKPLRRAGMLQRTRKRFTLRVSWIPRLTDSASRLTNYLELAKLKHVLCTARIWEIIEER